VAIGLISTPTQWYQGTILTPTWAQTVQDDVNGLLGATATMKGVYIDGTGAATVTAVAGKIVARGTAPSITPSTGAGSAPTISISGSDTAGTISLTVGAMPASSAVVFTVTFAAAFPTIMGSVGPVVILTPNGANAAALSGNGQVYISGTSTSQFVVNVGSVALSSVAYSWNYHVIHG
jgi:hypothetical protein